MYNNIVRGGSLTRKLFNGGDMMKLETPLSGIFNETIAALFSLRNVYHVITKRCIFSRKKY